MTVQKGLGKKLIALGGVGGAGLAAAATPAVANSAIPKAVGSAASKIPGVVSLLGKSDPFEVSKSVDAAIGRSAGRFVRGAKQGIGLANQGHSPIGPVGSGKAFRPTYSVRPGAKPATRLGVHAGVVGAHAPEHIVIGGALGAVHHERKKLAKSVEPLTDVFRVAKADNRSRNAQVAATTGLTGGAVAAGRKSLKLRQASHASAAASHDFEAKATAGLDHVQQRVLRSGIKAGQPGNLPKSPVTTANTLKELAGARVNHRAAANTAAGAVKLARRSHGAAGAAAALGAGAVAVASHKRKDAYAPVSYR